MIFFGNSPVFGHQREGADGERIEDRGNPFVADVFDEGIADAVSGEKHQAADERDDRAAGHDRDGEDDRGNQDRIWYRKQEDAVKVRRPVNGAPTLGIVPRHVFRHDDSEGDAEQRDDSDERGTQVASEQITEFLQRGGKEKLRGVMREIAGWRRNSQTQPT